MVGHSLTIEIAGPNDAFSPFADFLVVRGNAQNSSPGQIVEILGGSSAPSLQSNGSESNSNSVAVGLIHSALATAGVTSATNLVLDFGLNETGPVGSNSVTITDLQIVLERPGGALVQFSLLSDAVRVFNYSQGQSTAEARFELALGFDFMSEYTALSTDSLSIRAPIDNTSDGFEIFFVSKRLHDGGQYADPRTKRGHLDGSRPHRPRTIEKSSTRVSVTPKTSASSRAQALRSC